MLKNMDTYEIGKHAVGSIPPEDRRLSYGLISVLPRRDEPTIDQRLHHELSQMETHAYTVPMEVLSDIINGHPTKFNAAVKLLYDRLLIAGSRESFNVIYTPQRTRERETLTDVAIALTSGYPVANHPLMLVYSNGRPVVAVLADANPLTIVREARELKSLNMAIAAELKTTFDKVQPPLIVFENGSIFISPIITSHIFSDGLEECLEP